MKTYSKIKNIPLSDNPREKLKRYGVNSLTNSELLAIIIRTGTKKNNVIDLSRKILKKFNIKDLSCISLNQIIQFDGINKAKACQILACFELARRLSSYKEESIFFNSSKEVFEYLSPKLRFLKKEVFIGLYIDSRNKLIKEEEISVGTLNASLLHPREVFAPAIIEGAASIILVHNHPSGNSKPSDSDIKITQQIFEASKIMNIRLLDHIIIGNNNYTSLKDKNIF